LNERFQTGDWRLATGDWRLATGDWRLATGDWRLRETRFSAAGRQGKSNPEKPAAFTKTCLTRVVLRNSVFRNFLI
jgi:hypothetical protein